MRGRVGEGGGVPGPGGGVPGPGGGGEGGWGGGLPHADFDTCSKFTFGQNVCSSESTGVN